MNKAKGTSLKLDLVPYPPSLFSEESSFYGDEHEKEYYEKKAKAFNPEHFWDIHQWSLQCIAAEAKSSTQAQSKSLVNEDIKPKLEDGAEHTNISKRGTVSDHTISQNSTNEGGVEGNANARRRGSSPRNIYEGDMMAKQLDESLEEFLARLSPSRTTIETGPWIWIVDPHSPTQRQSVDYAGFKQKGFDLLEDFTRRKDEIEESNVGRKEKNFDQLIEPDRIWLENSILNLARSTNVVAGKWMLFPQPHLVDKIWATVAKCTLEGKLGCSAKVNTADRRGRLDNVVCIYTYDFSDTQDVRRVLEEMKRLELFQTGYKARPVYYKCDAYTYLDISSGNEYKLKASMYSSRDSFR